MYFNALLLILWSVKMSGFYSTFYFRVIDHLSALWAFFLFAAFFMDFLVIND